MERMKRNKPVPAACAPADRAELTAWLNKCWSTAAATRRWDTYNGAVAALQMAGFLVSEQAGRHKVTPHADA